MKIKKANTDYSIHELIENRWSPCRFLPDRSVLRDDLFSLFEAARCTSSSYNEQPWHFIISPKERTTINESLLYLFLSVPIFSCFLWLSVPRVCQYKFG